MNDHDFGEDIPTKIDNMTMEELMQSMEAEMVHSPGIPTPTSERPTKPIRPTVINNYERP